MKYGQTKILTPHIMKRVMIHRYLNELYIYYRCTRHSHPLSSERRRRHNQRHKRAESNRRCDWSRNISRCRPRLYAI